MAQVTPMLLSGSTNGRPVIAAATSSPGTTLHTAVSGTTQFDEITLYANCYAAGTFTLTIELGGTGLNDRIVRTMVNGEGTVLLVEGARLNNGAVVRAYCSNSSAVAVHGRVNRVTP